MGVVSKEEKKDNMQRKQKRNNSGSKYVLDT